MIESIVDPGVFRDANPLVVMSRVAISLAWVYALAMVWTKRHLPHANQALTGALAMVLSNSVTVFNVPVPYDVALFFVAMSQMILAIVFTQLFRLMSSAPLTEVPEIATENGEAMKMYVKVLLGLTSISVLALFVQYLAR